MEITVEHLINMLRWFDRNDLVVLAQDPGGFDCFLRFQPLAEISVNTYIGNEFDGEIHSREEEGRNAIVLWP